ncbi:hypothetical protein DH2020_028841 [Rehmannia glutinosa]|uniref:Ankyrin repeat-containing protein n=1 Tax=Rehmannia glutinosa TaxID=99300 RepID=A0ABR0VS08_REHGL
MSETSHEKVIRDMINYARTGNIDGLYTTIQTDPQFLKNIDQLQFVNTPLHEAAAAGETIFAAEIMNLNPSLGRKLNPDGLSPLHVALREDNIETAIALLRIDKQLVRVKGKAGFTPLHFAVKINTCLDVVARFLLDCPDSIDDLNNRSQTAVHVALESNNCDAAILLVNWLVRRYRENVVGWRDDKGNTALHVAVQYDCVQAVKTMLNIAKLNICSRTTVETTPEPIFALPTNLHGELGPRLSLHDRRSNKRHAQRRFSRRRSNRHRHLPSGAPAPRRPLPGQRRRRRHRIHQPDRSGGAGACAGVVVSQARGGENGDDEARILQPVHAGEHGGVHAVDGDDHIRAPWPAVQHNPPHVLVFSGAQLCHRHVLHIRFERRFRYHVRRVVVRDRGRLRGEDVVLCGESVVRGCVVAAQMQRGMDQRFSSSEGTT